MNPKVNTQEEERYEQDWINDEDDEEERLNREKENDTPFSDDM